MDINAQDMNTLRALAGRYSELVHLPVQKQRLDRYTRTNDLKPVRPVVLISEVPWGEIRDDALTNVCAPELAWLEAELRQTLYQWEHFQVDLVLPATFRVRKRIQSTGIGISIQETQIKGETGAYIASHEYHDQLKTEDDLAKLRLPELTYEKERTEKAAALAREVFAGLMDVEIVGVALHGSIWDDIAYYRGVDNLLIDLAMRPEFMHQTAARFAAIVASRFKQSEALGLLETNPLLLHCTPACTDDLPAPDFAGRARPQNVWGRCAAQIFGSVSPAMHDEFDLAYNAELFRDCGLVYYGCCEPMDKKVDILRKRFKNLRKISITPWADAETAARNIGRDYVLAAKPNPAFVARPVFNPEPVKQEIARYCEACQRHGTTLEFVLKDISTIANNVENLTQWSATVNDVIDRYYR